MRPDNPPVPDTWYAWVFRRVMPKGYDPMWSPPAVKKSNSARKEEDVEKSWEKNPTLTRPVLKTPGGSQSTLEIVSHSLG